MNTQTVEAEPVELTQDRPSKAVAIRQHHEVGQALTASQIGEKLRLIRQVMAENMKEGVDYGKVPGCGDKPGLFQPGAQKLSMTFQLNPEVREETITDYQNYHRGYRIIVRVSAGAKFAEGVGECSTLESKYRFRAAERTCPKCHKPAIIIGKEEYGGGFLCYKKKGGCGQKFPDNDPAIVSQPAGKVENDNPPDHWNTVQKMAFKRAFVHAIINATNTSELWSQDLEDLAANGVTREDDTPRNSNTRGMTGGNHGSKQDLGQSATSASAPGASRATGTESGPKTATAAPVAEPARTVPPSGKAVATEKHKQRMFEVLYQSETPERVCEYARAAGILLPTEGNPSWPTGWVPVTEEEMKSLVSKVTAFFDGHDAEKPFKRELPHVTQNPVEVPRDAAVGTWRAFTVPFGKNKGKTLGELTGRQLGWYDQNVQVSSTYEDKNGQTKTKSAETMKKDRAFRDALDAAKAEMGGTDE